MNSFVETVIQTSAGIEPGDFQQIFKEIRQELKRKGKNLILLIEDITSFTGVNQALLNALVTGHTGSNEVDNLCRLISVVGTTTQYYNQFRDNYRDRITKQITIHDGVIGENKNDLVQFVAKYLNAISLDSEVLDEWVKMVLIQKKCRFMKTMILTIGINLNWHREGKYLFSLSLKMRL